MKSIKPDNTGHAEAGDTSRAIIEGGVVGEHLAVQTHAGVLRGRGRRDGAFRPGGGARRRRRARRRRIS